LHEGPVGAAREPARLSDAKRNEEVCGIAPRKRREERERHLLLSWAKAGKDSEAKATTWTWSTLKNNSTITWSRRTRSGHDSNFGIFFGVRFFCFARNKQNLAILSGTRRELKVMAKTFSICLVQKTFPPCFELEPMWRKRLFVAEKYGGSIWLLPGYFYILYLLVLFVSKFDKDS